MENKNLAIRLAVEQDYPRLIELYRELDKAYGDLSAQEDEKRLRLWRDILADQRQKVFVGEVGGETVATLTLIIVPNLGHGGSPWAAVTNVVVDSRFRGRGFGTLLLDEAGKIARKEGCYKIVLSSNVVRKDAHQFYRRLGWRETHVGFSLFLENPNRDGSM